MDDFENFQEGLTSPASGGAVIAPNDLAELSFTTRAIYVGSGGDITLRLSRGDVVTLTNVQSGVIYPLRADQVLATGTTAGNLVGLR